MGYTRKKFKDQLVFVETDERGEMVIEKGRASMKYRLDDDRVYHPWPANITDPDGGAPAAGQAKKQRPRSPVKAAGNRDRAQKRAQISGHPPHAIVAYTDGACIGNPGLSGLGYLVRWPDGRRVQRGEPLGHGTNNRAELTAILRVLELLDRADRPVVIYTDSEYAIGVLVRRWKPKVNQELIGRIKKALGRFDRIELRKVPGHAGIAENELVDRLARRAADTQARVDRA